MLNDLTGYYEISDDNLRVADVTIDFDFTEWDPIPIVEGGDYIVIEDELMEIIADGEVIPTGTEYTLLVNRGVNQSLPVSHRGPNR